MKYCFFIFMIVCSYATLFAREFKYTYEGKTITYSVLDEDSKTVETRSNHITVGPGNYCSGDLILPEHPIDNDVQYTLVSIGDRAFYNNKDLINVTIPKTVTNIGKYAFMDCEGLNNIVIPEKVISIGFQAFFGCSSMTSITIPESVESIAQWAFYSCPLIKSLYFNATNCSVCGGNNYPAFPSSLESVTFGKNVSTIPPYAFWECKNLTTLNIPESVYTIGNFSFYNCNGLTSVSFPSDLNSIGKHSFFGCSELKNIVLPKNLKTIGEYAFASCLGLKSITVPEDVTSIGGFAFFIPKALDMVIFNALNCTKCGGYENPVFCSDVKNIMIGENVTSIPDYSFYNLNDITSLNLPNSLISIGDMAFNGCAKLIDLTIPESIASIGANAFSACYGIETLNYNAKNCVSCGYYNQSLKVHYRAFPSSIKNLIIGDQVTSIPKDAFYNCEKLSAINIPASVTSIGEDAFKGCYMINSVICQAQIPPTLGNDKVFEKDILTLGVPFESRTNYVKSNWTLFFNLIYNTEFNYLNDGKNIRYVVKDINNKQVATTQNSIDGDVLLPKNPVDEEAQIEYTLISIDDNSFSDCGITAIYIPESVEKIGKNAFINCDNLSNIVCYRTTPAEAERSSFEGLFEMSSLFVPDADIAKYQNNKIWGLFKNINKISNLNYIPVDNIEISLNSWSGKVGDEVLLTATVLPEEATDKTIIWTSSDESVATVTNEGLVTAVKVGEAIITAKTTDGSELSSSCKVTVIPTPATSVFIERSEWSGKVGEWIQLTATVLPEEATDKTIVWTSSDESVATVTNEGLITAVKVGEAIITAKTTDGSEVSASCLVKVLPILVNSISLDRSEWSGKVGESIQLTATVLPEDATDKSIVWTTSDETVATVTNEGLVTAVNVGEAIINAKTTDGSEVSASCSVKVLPILVNSISLNRSEWSGKVGESIQLTATVLPEDATDKALIWSSSDDSVATVNNEGLLTARKVGFAVITATSTDGSDISATCAVTVLSVLVESISVSPEDWSGEEGESFQLYVTLLPEDATDHQVIFISTDRSVAEVDQTGYVSVLNVGNCKIIVSTLDGSNLTAECLITSTAGIEEIFTDGETTWNVYDVNGVLLKKDCDKDGLKHLSSGLYILQSGQKTTKVIIR